MLGEIALRRRRRRLEEERRFRAVGAAAGVLGGLALAGGASYVEHKIEDRVTERVEEDMYGGDY